MSEQGLVCGDCLIVLPTIPNESVDLVLTDPPYGISFMGQSWDKALPDPAVWRECLRVLKPGGFAFIMALPRMYHRLAVAVEDAGFIVHSPILWAFACVSEDSEVFTPDGWKRWEQLHKPSDCDRILVYETETDTYRFEPPSAWHAYRVREDMFRIESGDTDQLVTRNHRVLTGNGFELAETLGEQAEVVFLPSLPRDIQRLSCRDTEEARDGRDVLHGQVSANGERLEGHQAQQGAWYGRAELDGGAETGGTGSHARREELGLEGRGNLLQDARELSGREVYPVSPSLAPDGAEGWLCYGTSPSGGNGNRQATPALGGCPPPRPRSSQQRFGEPGSLLQQSGAQTPREWEPYQTTVARISRVPYSGLVYCPTISTGCFVARRNGKIFLTGNSGFPKALDVGKQIDKTIGQCKHTKRFRAAIGDLRQKQGRTIREINDHFGVADSCTHWFRITQPSIPTREQWAELKRWWQIGDPTLDEVYEKAEREIVGEKIAPDGKAYSARQPNRWTPQFTDNAIVGADAPMETLPATPLAREWDGWKVGNSCLKPAYECILWAQKPPSEKTLVANVLKHGVGAINARAGAIPYEGKQDWNGAQVGYDKDDFIGAVTHCSTRKGGFGMTDVVPVKPAGRFPANLLVEDDVLDDGREHPSAYEHPHHKASEHVAPWIGKPKDWWGVGDSGSFSRYFSLDAWFDRLVANLPPEAQRTFPFLIVPKASRAERNRGLEDFPLGPPPASARSKPAEGRQNALGNARPNSHPTLKPLKLMLYLIMLATKPGYLVLDPFAGTGTTGMAAKALGRNFICIELEEKWCEIARARIAATTASQEALPIA